MSEVLSVRLNPEMDKKLNRLAKETGRTRSYYVKMALDEYLQDREDYLLALAVLEQGEPRTPINEVRKELGLEH